MDRVQEWDVVIDQNGGNFGLKMKELWRYRDLLKLFVRRDFVAFYKQTILGPIWFFLQPVFTTIIYIFLFKNLAQLSTDGIPGPLFYILGITIWTYFAETTLKVSGVFRENAGMFGKVYFPRLAMPISIVFSNLLKLGVQFVLFFCVILYYAIDSGGFLFTQHIVWFPFLIFFIALQSLGIGMIVASLAVKYRDLAMLITFGLQIMMYLSPVVYPLSATSGLWNTVITLNPMTTIIESLRLGFLGTGTVTIFGIIYTIIFSVLIAIIGTWIFTKTEKNFVDTI